MKKVEAYTAKKQGKIMLNANELYQNVSSTILAEIKESLSTCAFHRYPDETNQELIDAYAKVMNLDKNCILAGNGSDEMLGLMIGTFLGKGKKLFTLDPDFSMYDYYASMHEAKVIKYSTAQDGGLSIYDFIEKGREKKVDMILFSNPNNPTGHAMSNTELKKIIEAFPSIPIIIDEAYVEFAKESMLKYLSTYSNLYITRTLSKAYGLAGVRLGFLISNPENIVKLRGNVVPYNISTIDQKIGTIVLSHHLEYEALIEESKQARNQQYKDLQVLKNITVYPSQANYLFGRSPFKQQMIELLEEHSIIIRNYPNDTFRITIGSKEENMLIKDLLINFDKEVTDHENS